MSRPSLDTSKLALVYPRQSSGLQVRENIYSLENQMRLVDQAHADGFEADRVLVIDEDLGKSARTIEGRVGMVKALNLVDQGLVGALYAEDQTRLSRDKDTVDHMVIAKRCRLAGVPLYYGGAWRDLSDRGTRIAYKVEAVIGSEMWGLHQEKMYKALQAKASKGQMAARAPLHGYRVRKDLPKKDPQRDTLEVVPEEAAIIRELANQLEELGSLRKLSRAIEGMTWPNGSAISFGQLQKIFSKPVYRGHIVWGEIVTEGAHEAIISPEQGARIDAMLARNKVTLRRSTDRGAQFAGLLWCPECSRKLTTSPSRTGVGYVCARATAGPESPVIRHFQIQASMIDRTVMAHLWRRLDDGLINDIVTALRSREKAKVESTDLREGTLNALRRKVEGFTLTLANPDIPDAARRRLILELDKAARDLEAASAPPPSPAKVGADLAFYETLAADPEQAAALPLGWEDEPVSWRRTWLWRFIERVDVSRTRKGFFVVVVTFRDGSSVREEIVTRYPATEIELNLLRDIWNRSDRPSKGATAWAASLLAEAGFPRSESVTRNLLRKLNAEGRRKPPGQGTPRKKSDNPTAPKVDDAERELAHRLWADSRRPMVGWLPWLASELAAAGYPRTENGVRHVLKLAGISTKVVATRSDGSSYVARAPLVAVTDEELAEFRRLWASSDRPERGWVSWMTAQLAAVGFARSSDSVRYIVRRYGIRKLANRKHELTLA